VNFNYGWTPQAGPQEAFLDSHPYFDVLFGGARGGGKTDACLGEFLWHAMDCGSAARGVFMRREMPQADSLIDRSHDLFRPLGWNFQKVDRQWTAPNGAILRFRPLEDDRDAEKYQGQQFSRVYLEELTNWPTPKAADKMKATLRSARGAPVLFRATANPGGAGHHWVKMRYIDQNPMGYQPLLDESGEYSRMFIPAFVTDNVQLLTNDPGYLSRLQLSGSKELVRAWLEGDWNVVEGAFFDNWSSDRHITRPFTIPKHWLRFRSADWGSAKPFSIGWYGVASEDYLMPNGKTLPRGGLIKYREWYGSDGTPNVGLKMTAESVAAGILQREDSEKIDYSVMDPAAFASDGGPSIAERMAMPPYRVLFRPADNKRIATVGHMGGWDMLRHRLEGEANDRPMIVFFSTCIDSIRTIPLLQHDKNRAEDVDTDGEDHAGDETRYACLSRPWTKPQEKIIPQHLEGLTKITINDLWKRQASSSKGTPRI
jgi:hypothetical protein